jgi:integrase/recombinase XerD
MLLLATRQKLVGIMNKRKHNCPNEIHLFGAKKMAQARTLNEKELKLLLLYVGTRKYAARDRAMLLLTHWAGMRIGEVAATKIIDVLTLDGTIRDEIRLTAAQTKGRHARTVILSEKVRKELRAYLQYRFNTKDLAEAKSIEDFGKPLFATQKREGFSANTACYHIHMLYHAAGVEGSSHSGRRSFLTQLSAKSVPLKVMMELAGHRQAQTTMRYVNVTTDMKKAAVELL